MTRSSSKLTADHRRILLWAVLAAVVLALVLGTRLLYARGAPPQAVPVEATEG